MYGLCELMGLAGIQSHCFYSLFLRISAVRGYVLFLACASVLSLLFVPFFFVVLLVCFVSLFVCLFDSFFTLGAFFSYVLSYCILYM